MDGVGIPWCVGVIHELAQRRQKEETAQDGSRIITTYRVEHAGN